MKNCLVLGFFDGVHIAHQSVINSAVKEGFNPILVTLKNFNKSQEFILSRENSFKKIKMLGIKEIVELNFLEVSSLNAIEFLNLLKTKFNPVIIATGFNYTFGKNKCGNRVVLEENQEKYGYKYICTHPLSANGNIISSTYIKTLINNGSIELANKYLNSNFLIEGKVIGGAKLGRTIGFPTANLNYPKNIVKLPFGVYAVKIGDKKGIMNWGMKPTVHNTVEPIVEVHILEFEGDLYNQLLQVEIIRKIRDEKKFNSLDELRIQIKRDIESC